MGSTSNKDIEYRNYVLSDIKVIELLISYRYKYDDYLFAGRSDGWSSPDSLPFNEEMILTYTALDKYIDNCRFNESQIKMIQMIEQGYNYHEIAEVLNTTPSSIRGRLKTIYSKIVKENEWQWRKATYRNVLGLKSKKCSKCEEKLPATAEFYSSLSHSKDGFHSQCRNCKV